MDALQKLVALIHAYITRKFFGKIEISLESGNIVNVKVTESIKL